jgi:hypothetical protein
MYSDTFFSNCTSILGKKSTQLFVTNFSYAEFVLIKNKSDAGHALQELIKEVGTPKHLHTDGAKELPIGKWKQVCRDSDINREGLPMAEQVIS